MIKRQSSNHCVFITHSFVALAFQFRLWCLLSTDNFGKQIRLPLIQRWIQLTLECFENWNGLNIRKGYMIFVFINIWLIKSNARFILDETLQKDWKEKLLWNTAFWLIPEICFWKYFDCRTETGTSWKWQLLMGPVSLFSCMKHFEKFHKIPKGGGPLGKNNFQFFFDMDLDLMIISNSKKLSKRGYPRVIHEFKDSSFMHFISI